MLDGGDELEGATALGAVFQGGNAGKVRKSTRVMIPFVLYLNVHLGAWHQLGNPCAARPIDVVNHEVRRVADLDQDVAASEPSVSTLNRSSGRPSASC